eukprot:TRINITY_DN74232_c0_g1_i1.p1 TRINITY_DN74232_c0_g1~~TRINITY_DN74232_c0_g1_i1.p1  ORF type:complete len:560 (+),score=134.94 TRINITY_DN74232_c0_g1_i1:108-1787(+)
MQGAQGSAATSEGARSSDGKKDEESMAAQSQQQDQAMKDDGEFASATKARQSQMLLQREEEQKARQADSRFAKIASNVYFQNVTLGIIVVNAIWIFIDVQWNHANLADRNTGKLPLEPGSDVVENIFCIYFTVEVIIRFLAFRKFWYCFTDAWFVFDCTLVLMMVVETWVLKIVEAATSGSSGGSSPLSGLSSLRLLRLLRLTRMARLFSFFPELMTLVKGMFRAMQSVAFVLIFLLMVMYVFAIVFTSQLAVPPPAPSTGTVEALNETNSTNSTTETVEKSEASILFANLGASMLTLFTNGVLGDNLYSTLSAIRTDSIPLFWLFMAFVVISGMTLLNMLIGVLCQVIEDSGREETETRQLAMLRNCLIDAFTLTDESNDGLISEQEWMNIRNNATVQASLLKLGFEKNMIDERLDQMQESLFGRVGKLSAAEQGEGRAGLSFDEFMKQVIDLRMDRFASALDVEILKLISKKNSKVMQKKLDNIESELSNAKDDAKPREDPPTASETPDPYVQPLEDNAKATSGGHVRDDDKWLQDVPMELLLHVLKARMPSEQVAA